MYVEIILAASEYTNFVEMMRSYKQKLASDAGGAQWQFNSSSTKKTNTSTTARTPLLIFEQDLLKDQNQLHIKHKLFEALIIYLLNQITQYIDLDSILILPILL